MCGRGVVGGGVDGCGAVGDRNVAVATIDAVDRVNDANHLGFVVAVPVEAEEQQVVRWGNVLFEIDGPRDMQLHGVLLCCSRYTPISLSRMGGIRRFDFRKS